MQHRAYNSIVRRLFVGLHLSLDLSFKMILVILVVLVILVIVIVIVTLVAVVLILIVIQYNTLLCTTQEPCQPNTRFSQPGRRERPPPLHKTL